MSKVILKLSLNLQCVVGELPSEEEVASIAAELYEQCVRTVRESGGRTQRTREWRSEDA